MELFLLRHAIARPAAKNLPDAKRPLTGEGREKMRLIARAMRRLDLRFDLCLCSPFVRARQTAALVAKQIDLKTRITDTLVPAADPRAFAAQLRARFSRHRSLLVVGHQPHLGSLVSLLFCGNPRLIGFDLTKGGLVKLTLDQVSFFASPAKIEWLLTSRQLRLIGASGSRS